MARKTYPQVYNELLTKCKMMERTIYNPTFEAQEDWNIERKYTYFEIEHLGRTVRP